MLRLNSVYYCHMPPPPHIVLPILYLHHETNHLTLPCPSSIYFYFHTLLFCSRTQFIFSLPSSTPISSSFSPAVFIHPHFLSICSFLSCSILTLTLPFTLLHPLPYFYLFLFLSHSFLPDLFSTFLSPSPSPSSFSSSSVLP